MLPFVVSPKTASSWGQFTTGPKLASQGLSHRHHASSSNKKRYSTASHLTHRRSIVSKLLTRNRLILTVVSAALLLLTISYGSVLIHGKRSPDAPITQLQNEINSLAAPTPTPTPTHREIPTIPITSSKVTAIESDADAKIPELAAVNLLEARRNEEKQAQELADVAARLQAQETSNAKLQRELEAAKLLLQQQASQPKPVETAPTETAVIVTPSTDVAPIHSSASRALTSTMPIEVPSYPPIAIASTKKFSKFYCIGGRGRMGAQNDRSCRFQNICYKSTTNQWQFYQNPAEKLVVLLDKGTIIEDFPQEFLNLRSMGNPQDAKWWSPTVVKAADGIPESAFVKRANPDKPEINILYHPHYPSNMGHVIGDDLFPLFNLMSSFGMLTNNAQLILSRDCDKIFEGNAKKTEQCKHFLGILLPGITSKKYMAATSPSFINDALAGATGTADKDLVCFEQLLVGIGPWGFQQSLGKAPSWWSYHAFYLSNLGLNPQITPKKHRITVSIKNGKRAIANSKEMVVYLKEKFPQYEIDALELKSLGSWENELKYLQQTSVLITPCGGVSMSAMFMPHNSAMVIVDYFNIKKGTSVGMEERLWTNLGYVKPFHYPFTADEVELPADRKRTDFQDMRDWGQVKVDMSRMETIVKAAISHVDNFMVFGQE